MGVFKVCYTKGGTTKQSSKFYVEFKDHHPVTRRLPAFRGRRESGELLRIIEQLVACKHSAMLPGPDLLRAVEVMPLKVRQRLIEFGVLDQRKEHVAAPLAEHLDDYTAELVASGASAKWARTVQTRAQRIFDAAGCKRLSDITEGRVVTGADRLRKDLNLSDQTHNHGVAACKSFTRWATPERMDVDPLSKLKRRNAKANRVHARRALTPEESRALIAAAEAGPVVWKVEGRERALIYRVALETGLRAEEVRSLTRASFSLDAKHPSVTAQAKHTKNKKPAVLPLRPVLVELLRVHLRNKLPGTLAFNMPPSTHTAEMIRADLAAAKIPYEVDGAFADFHALRHSFITNLARAGVQPKVAQKLARHSSVTLTLDYYTHMYLGDDAEAVSRLPDLDDHVKLESA